MILPLGFVMTFALHDFSLLTPDGVAHGAGMFALQPTPGAAPFPTAGTVQR